MNNPYVILRIESHTCNCTNEPVIRQWLWPERINFERRNLLRVLCHEDHRACQQKQDEELSHLSHSYLSFYARQEDRGAFGWFSPLIGKDASPACDHQFNWGKGSDQSLPGLFQ